MQMLTGEGVLGILEHILDRDQPQVDWATTRHLMLTAPHTLRSQLHPRLGFQVSRASTMHLRHQCCHARHQVSHTLIRRNVLLHTMPRSSRYRVLVIGSA